jgi:hypothetical protein
MKKPIPKRIHVLSLCGTAATLYASEGRLETGSVSCKFLKTVRPGSTIPAIARA